LNPKETQHRHGEKDHYPFRSERFYFADNAWYFLIRGGSTKGPFDSRSTARSALQNYITTQGRLDQIFQNATDTSH